MPEATSRASRLLIRSLLIAAGTSVAVVPAAPAALPIACASPCVISASGQTGYVAPVTDIATGTSVSWFTTEDNTHPTTEGIAAGSVGCFDAKITMEAPTAPVRFDLAGGGLTATSDTLGTQTCVSAVALPDGSAALFYHCRLHPNMIGVLRVEP